MNLLTKHLSVRVPWHDNKWNGTICKNVLDNSFCRILDRIDIMKDEACKANEKDGTKILEGDLPPCMVENCSFLSSNEYVRILEHKLKGTVSLYNEYLPGKYLHKPFSLNAVPYRWMMKETAEKNHKSEKAEEFGLNYQWDLEEEIDKKLGYRGNKWVQHPENQKELLDSFFSFFQPKESLVFFYAKHTPLTEPNERVIIGVARIKNIGSIQEFTFPEWYKGYKGFAWDRCVEHSLTKDGVLLPYHELIEKSKSVEFDLHQYATIAPDVLQFSYVSELVENDMAIDALWRVAECFRKSEALLQVSYQKELEWIDREISRIWDMRGAFPSMGPVLSAIGFTSGNRIALCIENDIRDKNEDMTQINPWDVLESCMIDPNKLFGFEGPDLFNFDNTRRWKTLSDGKKEFCHFLSRIQLNNDQAKEIYEDYKLFEDWSENPYIIFEKLRYTKKGLLSFAQIDKGIFPPEIFQKAFPLEEDTKMKGYLDERRLRAFTVMILEEATSEGHTLLPIEDVKRRINLKREVLEKEISVDILLACARDGDFDDEIKCIEKNATTFLKLKRLTEVKALIIKRISRVIDQNKLHNIEYKWDEIVKNYFEKNQPESEGTILDDYEINARKEKAEALKILCNYRVSVLIGPAGSGKTTLLQMFENIQEIQDGGLIKLAPTGKARVKMGKHAKTVAQFLLETKRYDPEHGVYLTDVEEGNKTTPRNIIIDESSMLTEEQLGAVLSALGLTDRIILSGDYRQLPPIGSGRPFFDIVTLLKEKQSNQNQPIVNGYAELKQIRRGKFVSIQEREDLLISRCFCDEPQKEDIDLFFEITKNPKQNKHLRLIEWKDSKDFKEKFCNVLQEELNLNKNDIKGFNKTLGAMDDGEFQKFPLNHAEKEIENWQIISPIYGYGHGVKEINKLVQATYRKEYIDLALSRKGKIARPKGSDNIVYGDKVINLKNTIWDKKSRITKLSEKAEVLNYFANGEIGVITGEFKEHGSYQEADIRIAFSSQPGYSYDFWPSQLNDENKYSFDLAYAISVHKSQGSGFKVVFFVLPSKCAVLSRELFYTALTRQEDKIVILHQGDFVDFIKYASTEKSSTAKRFTDLFSDPIVKEHENLLYDDRHINISENGEKMISKSEVIIANCLKKYKDVLIYSYEEKLKIETSGRIIKPDFTIENYDTCKKFYWEHLGMMNRPDYREKWNKKKQGYIDDGYVLHTDATEKDEKVLIITEDHPNGGIDSQKIDEIVKKFILEQN